MLIRTESDEHAIVKASPTSGGTGKRISRDERKRGHAATAIFAEPGSSVTGDPMNSGAPTKTTGSEQPSAREAHDCFPDDDVGVCDGVGVSLAVADADSTADADASADVERNWLLKGAVEADAADVGETQSIRVWSPARDTPDEPKGQARGARASPTGQ
jgi:hypothetical protein